MAGGVRTASAVLSPMGPQPMIEHLRIWSDAAFSLPFGHASRMRTDREWFCKGSPFERCRPHDWDGIVGKHHDLICEGSGQAIGRTHCVRNAPVEAPLQAEVRLSAPAILTDSATDHRVDGDRVANRQPGHALANFGDIARGLVAHHHERLTAFVLAYETVDVRTAYATGMYLHADLSLANRQHRGFLDPEITRAIKHQLAHFGPTSSAPTPRQHR